MTKDLNEKELESVTGGQIIAVDGKYSNGEMGERYSYSGTCRVCKRKFVATEAHGSCPFCGGGMIWATHK